MKQFANAVPLIVCIGSVLFSPTIHAQITDQQAIDYVKNTWELTDLTDDVISQTLNTSYSGIPFKDYVSYFTVAPDILNPLEAGDYKTAGKNAANFAADQTISYLLEQAGLAGVAAPARLAVWPIEHGLNAFQAAVTQASFKNQIKLYFAARSAGNTYSTILALQDSDAMSADKDILGNQRDTITKYDGWLAFEPGYLVGPVPGYTPAQFYDYAEQQWLARVAADRFAADQAAVEDAFRAAAAPQRPIITQQPQDIVIANGQTATFTVVASGASPLTYAWYQNGSSISPSTGSSLDATVAGQYQVIISDANGLITPSRIATLTVNSGEPAAITAPTSGATLSSIFTVCASATDATKIEFYLDGVRQFTDSAEPFAWIWNTVTAVNGPHIITAKAYNDETLLGTSTAVNVTVNNAAPPPCNDPNEPNDSSLTATPLDFGVAANGYVCTASDVDWFRVNVTTPGVLTFNLVVPAANDYDLELFGPDTYYITGSYNDTGLPESIAYNATVAGTYYVRVYGYPVGSGSYNATVPYSLTAGIGSGPVTILTPPQNRNVPAGANASFSVIAFGATPLGYQWQRDNIDIPGATGPTYITPVLALGDSGAQFRVRVSNTFGFMFSDPATLTVTAGNSTTWTGAAGDGNWFNRTNWNPMSVPTASDVIQINAGSVGIPSNAQYAFINLAGGSLNGTFILNGSMNWSGGTLSGDVTIAPGGVLTLSGSADKVMSGAVITNGGTIIWSGTGNLPMNYGSVIENLAGGVFDVQTDATMYWPGQGSAPVFNNAGTFRKSAGSGTTTLNSVTFSNAGTVELLSGSLTVGSQFNQTGICTITTGTLTLQNGGTCQGNFDVSASSSLQLAGGSFVLSSNVVFSGPGLVRVSNASITLNGSYNLLNFKFDSNTTISGTNTLSGAVNWAGGTLTGDMTIAPNCVLTLSGSADKVMSSAVLRNEGTVIWSGTGNLPMNYGSIIENLAGAVFDVQTDATMYWPGQGSAPVFNNAGTFRKSAGSGTTTLNSVSFNNTGTVDVVSGTANFASNNLRLQPGSQLTGTGRVIGSVTLNGNVAVQNLELTTGTTFTGTGTLSGTINWTGGTLSGDVTIAPGGVLTLSGSADKTMSGGVLRNGGTIIWSGTGNLPMNYGSVIENLAGGVFDVQTDATMYWPGQGSAPVFNNAGTFRKSAGSGTTTLNSVTFSNAGTVDALNGTLNFNSVFNQTSGDTRLSGGSLNGSIFNFAGGTLSGSGTVNASVVNAAVVSPGSSPGTITINGNYTQTAQGVLQMELAGLTPGGEFDQLVVNGQAALEGALNVTLFNGFTPAFSDAFTILTYTSRSGSFATVNLPALPNALALTSQYTPSAMTLLTANTTGRNATNTLTAVATGTGPLELRFTGEPGQAYRLQASTNLTDWVNLVTNTPINGLIRFVDSDMTNMDRRFYRTVSP